MKKLTLLLLTLSFIFCGCDVGKKETESSMDIHMPCWNITV